MLPKINKFLLMDEGFYDILINQVIIKTRSYHKINSAFV